MYLAGEQIHEKRMRTLVMFTNENDMEMFDSELFQLFTM